MADYQKGKRGKPKPVIWLGIQLSPIGGTILYIISVLGLITCSFGLIFNVFWYVQYLGIMASYGEYASYGTWGSEYMLVYIIFLVALMIFFIYNIRIVRKAQGR